MCPREYSSGVIADADIGPERVRGELARVRKRSRADVDAIWTTAERGSGGTPACCLGGRRELREWS